MVGQHIQHHAPENFITSAGFGTMGFGLPAAIGAKKARPQDEVILVNGDGSIKRGKAPIKIVLLDNQRLSMGASSNLCFSMPATATPF
ncbi:acetolactate synthase [Aggregatibacter actinomycetemcomitans NUM4039]|nr:acetolactate synthase [Aggregatibacter actinomycetemcomitans NUM4039]